MPLRTDSRLRRLTAASLAAVCVSLGLPVSAHAADAAAEPTLTGTLRTPDGQPIANANITISVEPPSNTLVDLPAGSEIHPTDVGWGYSWEDGSFNTWIADPSTLLAARDEDGLIALVLTAPTDKGQVFYRSRVVLGDDGVLRPYAEDVAADGDPQERQGSLSAMSAATNGRPAFDLVSTQVDPNETRESPIVEKGSDCPTGMICSMGAVSDETAVTRNDQPAYDAAVASANVLKSASGKDFAPDVWCGGHHWFLKKSRDTTSRKVVLSKQATRGHSKGTFKYETSKNTAVEIGVTNRAGAIATTLGFEKGKTTKATIKSKIPANTKAEWWISYGFNLMDVMCQNRSTGKKWWSGYTEYRPTGFTGDFSRRTWKPFACEARYRNTLGPAADIQVATDKTTTMSGAFGITDKANLKATQKWTTAVTIGYKGDSSGFNICGRKGRWIAGVTQTQEVP